MKKFSSLILNIVFEYFKCGTVKHKKLGKKLKLSLSKTRAHTVRVEVKLHSFLTSAVDGGKRSGSRPGSFAPVKDTRYPLNRQLRVPHRRFGRFR